MTYRFEDWQVGDLAWIVMDDAQATGNNKGRQLRMLIRRNIGGRSDRGARWNAGDYHWIASHGGWVRANSNAPGLIISAERMVVVTPEEADRINDTDLPF